MKSIHKNMPSLLPHQLEAIDALAECNGRMLLWGDPGIGKTAIALKAAERAIVKYNRPVLFICPSIVKQQVFLEAHEFVPSCSVAVLQGAPDEREAQWAAFLAMPTAPIIIINYEQLLTDTKTIQAVPWVMIVIDECHKTASPTSKQVKAIKKMKSVPFRLAMSGTPAPNALHEFYSMIDWLSPGILGDSFYDFRRKWCKTNPYIPQKIEGYHDEERLRSIIDSFIHRIKASDVLADLPKLTEHVVFMHLNETLEVPRYKKLKKEMVIELADKPLTVPNALACLMRLRQLVDCPRIFGFDFLSTKEIMAYKIVDEWLQDPNARVLVFTELAECAKRLASDMQDYGASLIVGETNQKTRTSVLDSFNAGRSRVLVGSSAIQTGLNIQTATHILHYGVTWNQARMDQRTARAHRKGVEHPVESVILLAKGTVDEHMHQLCKEKAKLSAGDLVRILKQEYVTITDNKGAV